MLTDAKLAHPDELKEEAAARRRHFNDESDPPTPKLSRAPFESAIEGSPAALAA
jgi:hypothetical protein